MGNKFLRNKSKITENVHVVAKTNGLQQLFPYIIEEYIKKYGLAIVWKKKDGDKKIIKIVCSIFSADESSRLFNLDGVIKEKEFQFFHSDPCAKFRGSAVLNNCIVLNCEGVPKNSCCLDYNLGVFKYDLAKHIWTECALPGNLALHFQIVKSDNSSNIFCAVGYFVFNYMNSFTKGEKYKDELVLFMSVLMYNEPADTWLESYKYFQRHRRRIRSKRGSFTTVLFNNHIYIFGVKSKHNESDFVDILCINLTSMFCKVLRKTRLPHTLTAITSVLYDHYAIISGKQNTFIVNLKSLQNEFESVHIEPIQTPKRREHYFITTLKTEDEGPIVTSNLGGFGESNVQLEILDNRLIAIGIRNKYFIETDILCVRINELLANSSTLQWVKIGDLPKDSFKFGVESMSTVSLD